MNKKNLISERLFSEIDNTCAQYFAPEHKRHRRKAAAFMRIFHAYM
jgi:hypothetical protein